MKKNATDNNDDDDECTALVVKRGHQLLDSWGRIVYMPGHQDLGHWVTDGIWDPLCVLYQTPAEGFSYTSDRDGLFVKE